MSLPPSHLVFQYCFEYLEFPTIPYELEDRALRILVSAALTLYIALGNNAIRTLSLTVKTLFSHLLGLYFSTVLYNFSL